MADLNGLLSQKRLAELRKRYQLDEDSFASVLLLKMVDQFDFDVLQWHPQTMVLGLQEVLGRKPNQVETDQLFVATALINTNSFYSQLSRFITFCNVLSGAHISLNVVDIATAEECAWGVAEAAIIWTPDEEDDFSEEIKAYVRETMNREGLIRAPKWLEFSEYFPDLSDARGADPLMAYGILEDRDQETQDIEREVSNRLRSLLKQIERTKFERGDVKDLKKKIMASYKSLLGS